jgi:hypothetical protein
MVVMCRVFQAKILVAKRDPLAGRDLGLYKYSKSRRGFLGEHGVNQWEDCEM